MSNSKATPTERDTRTATVGAPNASDTTLSSFIWKNAEDLWGDFKHTDFGKIILKPKDRPDTDQPPPEGELILKPIGPGGGGQAAMPVYLRQVIARLNSIFGEVTPLADRAAMVNQVADITREDAHTMAQFANNSREDALKGNITGTVQAAVVRPYQSHQALADHLLDRDQQALAPLTALIYELVRRGRTSICRSWLADQVRHAVGLRP